MHVYIYSSVCIYIYIYKIIEWFQPPATAGTPSNPDLSMILPVSSTGLLTGRRQGGWDKAEEFRDMKPCLPTLRALETCKKASNAIDLTWSVANRVA